MCVTAEQAIVNFNTTLASKGHPSSPSVPGRAAMAELEKARSEIANLIEAESPSNIIFTLGCSQACEWGLEMFCRKAKLLGYEFAISPIEHPVVRDVFSALNKETINYLNVNEQGTILSPGKKANCCIHLQNEIGTIQPIETLGDYLFSDMSQSLGKIPVNVQNVDIAVFGAHKFGGPGGVGFIYLKDTKDWTSFGLGSRYFLDRAGTPDVAGVVATAAALEEAVSTLEDRTKTMLAFQSTLEVGLEKLGLEIVGKGALRSPNTSFVGGFEGYSLNFLMELGEKGIHVGLGSACGSLHNNVNNTMKVIKNDDKAWNYLRISQWGWYGEKEAKIVIAEIEKLCLRYI